MGTSSGHAWELDAVDGFVIADVEVLGCFGVFFWGDGWDSAVGLSLWLCLGVCVFIMGADWCLIWLGLGYIGFGRF